MNQKALQLIEKSLNNIEKSLNKPNIKELPNEPNDELFIDALFACTAFYELGGCFRRHPDVLKRFVQVSNENALKKIHSQCNNHLSYSKKFTIDSIDGFNSIIPKFTFKQRVELLESNTSKTNTNFLEPFFSFEELRSLLKLDTRIRYRRLEAFFVNRLVREKSTNPEEFATEVLRCAEHITSWRKDYPNFLEQLHKKEIHFIFFKKSIALLATNELKPLEENTSSSLRLLLFLQQNSDLLHEKEKHDALKAYTPEQLYTLCLQLQKKNPYLNSEELQNLFYPLCFNLLNLTHLQQLKKKAFPTTFQSILWPNPLTRNIEKTLSEKVKTEGAPIRDWSDAITTWERNLALFLFLIGISLLVSGFVLNIVIMWAIAIAPLAIGFGIVGIPLLRTAINSIGRRSDGQTIEQTMTATTTQPMTESTEKTFLLNSDHPPTSTKREETTSQETLSTQPNPIPFNPMFQPATSSISAQNNVQRETTTTQSPSDPSPY